MPNLLLSDSQAVKNTESAREKGFCAYKLVNGIKRHLTTDTLGCLPMLHATKVNVSDNQGLIELISKYLSFFKNKPVNIKKITFLVDNGYSVKILMTELIKVYPAIKTMLLKLKSDLK
jgi:hypothetical protein